MKFMPKHLFGAEIETAPNCKFGTNPTCSAPNSISIIQFSQLIFQSQTQKLVKKQINQDFQQENPTAVRNMLYIHPM